MFLEPGKELRLVEEAEKYMAYELLPKDIVLLAKKGILKQHDFSKFALGMHNCLFIDYPKLLDNGFKTRQADVRPAHSYSTACHLLPVIIQTQSLDQFGGCGIINWSVYMTKYLKYSISNIVKMVSIILDLQLDNIKEELTFHEARNLLNKNYYKAKLFIDKEVIQSNQALITNLVTLQSRSGHQLPFSSLNLGLIDENNEEESAYLIEMFLLELNKGIGKKDRTAIFPITIFQVKSGINRYKEDKYYYLRLLAQKVAHKRLYPTFANCNWSGNKASCLEEELNLMGCRTILGYNIIKNNYIKAGRGNNVPVTINLPYLALLSNGNKNLFFDELTNILYQARRSLLVRFDIMKKQSPSVAPFMYENETIIDAKLCKDTVEEALKNNSLAIGYIGLAECLKVLTGFYHNENEESQILGIKIIKTIRDFCDECTKKDNLNFVTYATPAEGYCYEAMEAIKRDFGIIKDVSDKEYLTNSHHCPVYCNIPVFEKIDIESPYSKLANGGNIFNVEVNGIVYNEKAMTKALDYALDKDISYIRFSHPISTCMDCGYNIGKFMDSCEVCGSSNTENLAIVTGYLTTDVKNMNKGKQQEVKMRELNIIKEDDESLILTNI